MDAQLKRGMLEVLVLSALNPGESYGYQIIKDISPIVAVSESTLYPILRRLEASDCLEVSSREHNGRIRKYYRLTDEGRARIREFLDEWDQLMQIYRYVREEYLHDQG